MHNTMYSKSPIIRFAGDQPRVYMTMYSKGPIIRFAGDQTRVCLSEMPDNWMILIAQLLLTVSNFSARCLNLNTFLIMLV